MSASSKAVRAASLEPVDPVMPGPLADAASRPRPRTLAVLLCLASFMAGLDLFIVNVAFDEMGHTFASATLGQLSWILNAYAITYAALLVPLGRLADRFGRREGFLLGLALFTVASAACAGATSLWALVAFRAIKAVGAALLTPTSLALLLAVSPPEGRAKAVRIWAVTGALAAAAGPVLGGLLVALSWRWVFLVNVPIGVAAFLGARALLREVDPPREAGAPWPDLLGAALLAIAIGSCAFALVAIPDHGPGDASVLGAFAVAAATSLSFVLRSRSHPVPVVDPSLLRVRSFAWANLATVAFNVAFAANLLAIVLWMQRAWHVSSSQTGFAVTPGPLMVPLFAALAQRVMQRGVRSGVVAALGCVLVASGALVMAARVGPSAAYATQILPGWLLSGAGVGLAMPTILSSATAELPPARSATGSAIVTMSRQIGAVLGVGLLVVLLGKPEGFEALRAGFRWVWGGVALVALVAAGLSLRMNEKQIS